jgi:hypothetical protein
MAPLKRAGTCSLENKKSHYNKGNINKVVLDHISTYKLNNPKVSQK